MKAPGAKRTSTAEGIARTIRSSIISGELTPGMRLPTRPHLLTQHGISWCTLQKAIDRLREDGFVETRGRNGTFVASSPPHLNRYGLVFNNRRTSKWSRFYLTLQHVALAVQEETGCHIDSYYHNHGDDRSPDYQALLKDVVRHRLAGLIFVSNPGMVQSPVLIEPGIPRVGITGASEAFPVVTADSSDFWGKALEYCKASGRHRVAALVMHRPREPWESIDALVRQAGLETRPYWKLSFTEMQTVTAPVELLMRLPPDQRPNALIIGDDNLVEAALEGVSASGVIVPEEVQIIAHCNFPAPPPGVVPVRRLGYDCGEFLRACCNIIDRQQRGEAVPSRTLFTAKFEEELTKPNIRFA